MSSSSPERQVGGIKGFFQRAGRSFSSAGATGQGLISWMATHGARWGLIVASTSMVILMPLIFEINREAGSLANERVMVTELRNQGHSDRQLQEMGFLDIALHKPSVAGLRK